MHFEDEDNLFLRNLLQTYQIIHCYQN